MPMVRVSNGGTSNYRITLTTRTDLDYDYGSNRRSAQQTWTFTIIDGKLTSSTPSVLLPWVSGIGSTTYAGNISITPL